MSYEGLRGNDNAEKWNLEDATVFMNDAVELSKNREYDFIGEIARKLGLYKEIFSYLVGKFPELKRQHKTIYTNCESNCFYNGKKQNIVPSMAIMNLKSNHGRTDRVEQNQNIDFRQKLNDVFDEVDDQIDGEEKEAE